MSRPITYDYRAPRRFRVRALPVAYVVAGSRLTTLAKWGAALYLAQAAGGVVVGFTIPWLQLLGVL